MQNAERLSDVRQRIIRFLTVCIDEEKDMSRAERATWANLEAEERIILKEIA
jgi:hypothetical protein